MRRHEFAITIFLMLAGAIAASAQTPEADEHPYGLDPYKPSDAALLRDYGDTLVAQTPLTELRKLDPYKPSQAALRRAIGGAIPLWGTVWYPYVAPLPQSLTPFPSRAFASRGVRRSQVANASLSDDEARTTAAPVAVTAPTSMTTLRPPESNDGVWILFEEQKWISAGRPIPFERSEYVSAGEYENIPVFKRSGAQADQIFLLMGSGLVAPYRLKR
jgi:hypothetical protein